MIMQIFTRNKTPIPKTPEVQAGFTLVELMVVMFLIGLAATAVVLTVGGVSRAAGSQAEQFAARIGALRDRAVVEARPFAFWVRPSGYGFEVREDRQWRPLAKKPFATTNWQAPLTANMAGQPVLRIAFDANGLPSAPMDITLSGGATPLRVKLDAAGNVDVSR
jgi:general secretion pathway protein H